MFTYYLHQSNQYTKLLLCITVLGALMLQTTVVSAQEATNSRYTVTQGTLDSSMPAPRNGNRNLSEHGFRFFCVPSHFSYDDPVVYPGEAGAAHAHMFFGNTDVDYQSTSASIITSGRSTCDGGITNRSAYWVPAMYNQDGEIVLPKQINLYYKSWVPDRSQLQPVPAGLQILANHQVDGANVVVSTVDQELWQGTTRVSDHDGLTISVLFPDCIEVDSSGNPVLTSPGGTSHVAFSDGGGCPSSHPYNIPQLSLHLNWDTIPFDSDWQLASDISSGADKGTTAHADYIAGWTEESAQIMVDCVRDGYRECGPPLHGHADDQFFSADGQRVYRPFNIAGDATPDALHNWPAMLTTGSHHNPAPTEEPPADPEPETDPISKPKPTSKPTPQPKVEKDAKPVVSYKKLVSTTDNLIVRDSPNGTRIGTQLAGAHGTITNSARIAANGYNWVFVDFEDSPDGYVAGEFLQAAPAGKANMSNEEILNLISSLLEQIKQLQQMLDAKKATN